jgi:hypothetical protein
LIINGLSIDVLSSDDIVYDPILLSSLRNLNHYYLSHFSVYIFLMLTIGYFIFIKQKN